MRIIKEIKAAQLESDLAALFSYVIPDDKIAQEYDQYISLENRKLYGFFVENIFVGMIGIEYLTLSHCELKHIAVSPIHRKKRTASCMIDFVCQTHSFDTLTAEADIESVGFYRNYGFDITSLGEKYAGVERFLCTLKK